MKNFLGLIIFSLVHACCPASASLNDVDKAQIAPEFVLDNPAFQNGKVRWAPSTGSWSIAGTGLDSYALWDASASTQTFCSSLKAVPERIKGKNGLGYLNVAVPSGAATHLVYVSDGTNRISNVVPVFSSTAPVRNSVNFIWPSSGSVRICLEAQADEPAVRIYSGFLGDATNLTNVSQATLIGSAIIPGTASCDWTRTNTAFGPFGTVAACPGPTVLQNPGPGIIQTTDANLPRFTVNSLPPGTYQVRMIGYAGGSTAGGFLLRINDGTNSSLTGFANANTGATQFTADGIFTYTSAGDRTFELQGLATTGTINLFNANTSYQVSFQIYRFPSTAEQVFAADTVAWKLDLNIAGATSPSLGTSDQTSYIAMNSSDLAMTVNTDKGSAPAGISCSSTNDNTVGSTTCSAGSEELGFVANFPRAGLVEVCHAFTHRVSTGTSGTVFAAFQVVRTANGSQTIAEEGDSRINSTMASQNTSIGYPVHICGTFQIPAAAKHTIRLMYEQDVTATVSVNSIITDGDANIGQRDVRITARYIDQSMPAPLIRNSVVTSSSGVTASEYAIAQVTGASACQVNSQSGTWIASAAASSSNCTLTLTAGTFSAAPTCTATATNSTATSTAVRFVGAPSASTVVFQIFDTAFSTGNGVAHIHCMGPK